MVDGDGRSGRERVLCHMTSNHLKPASTAITAGRDSERIVARTRALGVERLAVDVHGRRQPARHVAATGPVLRPLRQPDRAFVRGSDRRTRRRRGRDGVRVRHGCDRHDRARRSVRRAPTSWRRASSTPARWRSCRVTAPGSASRRRSSTARAPARSPRPCTRGARRSCSPRHRRTRGSNCATSTRSARSPARSRSSTRRSPRRSASSRWRTASTSCCTRRRRASPATTTPRSGSSPASATCSTRSGCTACCTARRRHRSTPSTHCAASARSRCAPRTRRPPRSDWRSGSNSIRRCRPCTTPGLASHPQHDLAKRQMRQFGTVLAFDLAGGQDGRAPAVRHDAVGALRDVARRARDVGLPSDDDHPRQPHRPRSRRSPASPRAWCGCRSASKIPTTWSPTSSKPSRVSDTAVGGV